MRTDLINPLLIHLQCPNMAWPSGLSTELQGLCPSFSSEGWFACGNKHLPSKAFYTYIHACIHTYIHTSLHPYIHPYISLRAVCPHFAAGPAHPPRCHHRFSARPSIKGQSSLRRPVYPCYAPLRIIVQVSRVWEAWTNPNQRKGFQDLANEVPDQDLKRLTVLYASRNTRTPDAPGNEAHLHCRQRDAGAVAWERANTIYDQRQEDWQHTLDEDHIATYQHAVARLEAICADPLHYVQEKAPRHQGRHTKQHKKQLINTRQDRPQDPLRTPSLAVRWCAPVYGRGAALRLDHGCGNPAEVPGEYALSTDSTLHFVIDALNERFDAVAYTHCFPAHDFILPPRRCLRCCWPMQKKNKRRGWL